MKRLISWLKNNYECYSVMATEAVDCGLTRQPDVGF